MRVYAVLVSIVLVLASAVVRGAPTQARYAPLKMTIAIPEGCDGGDMGGAYTVSCGPMGSMMSIAAWMPGIHAENAAGVLKRVGEVVADAKLTELGRTGDASGWLVTYQAKPAGRDVYFGFHALRKLSSGNLYCQAVAQSRDRLQKLEQACRSLAPLKP